jgi:MFS transporter, SP family, sugar:H+ symporter
VTAAPPANRRYVSVVAAGAALGGFLFGYDTSTMNSAINGIRATLDLSPTTTGFVAAIALIGCAIGAWFAGPVALRLGRTRVMLIAGAVIVIGSLGVAIVSDILLIGAFRLATGLGIGAASAVVPSYVAEISPTAIRGRLGTFWQFAIVIGQFLGLLAGFAFTSWAGSEAASMPWGGEAWRWMFVIVAVLAGAYLLVARALPTSPADLVRMGHEADARTLLSRIGGDPVEDRMGAIEQSLRGQSHAAGLGDLRGRAFGLRPVLWIGLLLAMFQQLVGINVVKTYSNALWQLVGFSTSAAFVISLITVGISIASTVVAIAVMDRVNRRTLLGAGAAAMVVSLAVLAVALSSARPQGEDVAPDRVAGIAALIAMNVFAVAFGITWGPVMWLMLGELFDTNLRTTAVAVCTAVNWTTNWLVTQSFPILASIGLGLAYGLYAGFAALAVLFVWKMLPETRGRTLS